MKIATALLANAFVFATVAALGACSPDRTPAPQPAAQAAKPAPAAPAPSVLDDQTRALQKARDVNQTMEQRNADVDAKVKDGGG